MTAIPVAIRVSRQRWLQLTLGIVCMAMIANLQYGWTLFVNPIDAKYHWGRAAIQVAFSIFVLTETWLVPVEGWFVDRYGPKVVVLFGGVLVGVAWMMNSVASSLPMLYVAAAVGGIGAGAVYGTCIGNALKWFSDLRGLAAGLTAAGFGAGSALTVIPIQGMIAAGSYEAACISALGRASWSARFPGSCGRPVRAKSIPRALSRSNRPDDNIRRSRWFARRSSGSCT